MKLNAENAAQANKLASETSESTTPGNDVVAQVVAIMNGITESNHEIADITTLIDGIAFQTNRSRLARRLDILASGAPRKGSDATLFCLSTNKQQAMVYAAENLGEGQEHDAWSRR